MVKLDKLWNQQFKTEVSSTAKLHNVQYYIGLPFKYLKVCMPDNRSVAEQCLQNLKKSFMSDIICEGYAEKVSDRNLERNDGRK